MGPAVSFPVAVDVALPANAQTTEPGLAAVAVAVPERVATALATSWSLAVDVAVPERVAVEVAVPPLLAVDVVVPKVVEVDVAVLLLGDADAEAEVPPGVVEEVQVSPLMSDSGP